MADLAIADAITIGSAAAVGLGALWAFGRAAVAAWRRTLGLSRTNRALIDALAIGMYVPAVFERFGSPIIAGRLRTSGLRVYRFDLRQAWVSIAVSPEERVDAFSVTVTSRWLRWRISWPAWAWVGPVRLGRASFSAVFENEPSGVQWWVGARSTAYREVHYFGNPGWYLYYALGAIDAGLMRNVVPPPDWGHTAGLLDASDDIGAGTKSVAMRAYRARSVPNTFSVLDSRLMFPPSENEASESVQPLTARSPSRLSTVRELLAAAFTSWRERRARLNNEDAEDAEDVDELSQLDAQAKTAAQWAQRMLAELEVNRAETRIFDRPNRRGRWARRARQARTRLGPRRPGESSSSLMQRLSWRLVDSQKGRELPPAPRLALRALAALTRADVRTAAADEDTFEDMGDDLPPLSDNETG